MTVEFIRRMWGSDSYCGAHHAIVDRNCQVSLYMGNSKYFICIIIFIISSNCRSDSSSSSSSSSSSGASNWNGAL
jgi:hypothetical protein